MADTRAPWEPDGSSTATETRLQYPIGEDSYDPDEPGRELAQRMIIAGIFMVLIWVTATLWGLGGTFRSLFTGWVVWFGWSVYQLYIKKSST